MTATSGNVCCSYFRNQYDLQLPKPYPGTKINILVIQKIFLIEATHFSVNLTPHYHEHTANPLRINRSISNHIVTASAVTRCFTKYLERRRKTTRTIFNHAMPINHQRRYYAK